MYCQIETMFIRSSIILLITLILNSSCTLKINRTKSTAIGTNSINYSAKEPSYKQKAKEVYDTVESLFSIPGSDLFKENSPKQNGDPLTAYFWSHTGMFTAAILLQYLGYQDSSFDRCIQGMNEYWDNSRSPAGYQSVPVKYGRADRFYDDNATAGLDFVEAYKLTGNQHFLEKARGCLTFDKSGESSAEGGGLFWDEEVKNNLGSSNCIKATNATAFTVSLALELFQIDRDTSDFNFAKRLYDWNKTYMQDPKDKLYWNDIALKNGEINKTKWTYNVGEVITNDCLFFKITEDSSYLKDAQILALASYKHFTRPISGKGLFFPQTDPWFTAILFRGYLDLLQFDHNPFYINAVISNVNFAWRHAVMPNGEFMEDWSGQVPGRYYWILTQAAMVEIYARIAILIKQRAKNKLF